MADTVTGLKVRFGADTKNFKKDLESGKAAVDNFSNEAKGSLSSFAEVFGINLDAVSDKMKALQKAFSYLWEGFKGAFKATEDVSKLSSAKTEATKASEGLATATTVEATATTAAATAQEAAAGATLKHSAAWKVLKLAIASTGIGLLIVALGTLVSYFTKTERGAEGVEKVMASFKAILNVLIDRLSVFGEGLFKIFTGKFGEGWEALKKSVSGLGSEIANESKQAWKNTEALQALEDREIALIEVQGKRRRSIEELRLKAKDLTLTEEERLNALAKAIQIQKDYTADEVSLQKERVRIQEEHLNMGEKMDDDNRALAESKAKLNDIEAEGLSTIRGMSKEYNSLTKSIEENAKAAKRAAEEKAKADNENKVHLIPSIVVKKVSETTTTESLNIQGLETDKLDAADSKIKAKLGDIKETTITIGAEIQSAMNNMAVSFGENLGLMIAGADGAKSINEILSSVFGDMLINIGKAAITAGTTFLAIGEMFRIGIATPGAAIAAIAAGIAMVALGTAFKSAVSSATSGGSTYSSGSAGSTYGTGISSSGSSNSIRSAPQTIIVQGEFKLKNGDLVAAIDKNNQRRIIST